jgi:uncharacterized protein YeaO (DUF488 family)
VRRTTRDTRILDRAWLRSVDFAVRKARTARLFDVEGDFPAMNIRIKRVYEEADKNDGKRVLVDRLWPRGLTKEKAKVDLWLKDVAPSTELRKWFAHDPARWPEFKTRYREELKKNKEQVSLLEKEVAKGPVTLVYGARDQEHNEAVVLQELLESK